MNVILKPLTYCSVLNTLLSEDGRPVKREREQRSGFLVSQDPGFLVAISWISLRTTRTAAVATDVFSFLRNVIVAMQ